MKRGIAQALAAAIVSIASAGAWACPLCLYSFKLSLNADDLFAAQRAVLAVPVPDSSGYRVVAVIKGNLRVDEVISESVFRRDSGAAPGKPRLLLRQDKWASWVSFGAIDSENAAWLRLVAAMRAPNDGDASAWGSHVAFFVPYLDSPEPMIADAALGEVSRAPYQALRAQKATLDLAAIRRAVDNPALMQQHSTYILLLGVAGNAEDANRIEQRLASARQVGDATHLGALLAADLELRGLSRLSWVESTYLFDPRRTPAEVEAGLSALTVQGSADATIPRARVIAIFRKFIRERPALAGLVAPALASWDDWSAVPDYLELMRTDALRSPASRYAALNYVMRSPRATDHAAARALAARLN